MIVLEPLRWLLTVAFAVVTAYHLAYHLRPRRTLPALDAPHLLMGPAMIVMIWPWGRAVPATAWLVLFATATGWFLAQLISSSGPHRYFVAFSASAMAAMVWMGLAPMPAAHTMPGMDMPMAQPRSLNWISAGLGAYLVLAALLWFARGLRLARLPLPATGPPSAQPSGADIPGTCGETVAGAGSPNWPAVCHGVMSAAMGLALLAMP